MVAKRRSLSLWRFNFFGLTPEYRALLFKTLHEIVYYGKGGYTWYEVYNFPCWLRRVSYQFIVESINEENKTNSSTSKGRKGKSSNFTSINMADPDRSLVPIYTTNTSKSSKR